MKITLIRHGRTIGNVKGCFNGVTNDPLCDEGVEIIKEYVEKGIYPEVGIVVSSPLKRCLQTSNLIYPQHKPIVVDKLILGILRTRLIYSLKITPTTYVG